MQGSLLMDRVIPKKKGDGSFSRTRLTSEIPGWIFQADWKATGPRLLGAALGVVIVGMLAAGLWPFHSPRNQVTWLAGGHGVRFGLHGTILGSFEPKGSNVSADAPCSLEIWFQPARPWSLGTLIHFYSPCNGRQFSLHQVNGRLAVESDPYDRHYRAPTITLFIEDVLLRPGLSFVTITSAGGHTLAYVDGRLVLTAVGFPLSGQDLHGELVIANSARIESSWSGLLRGLAVYDECLSPTQVVHHYETWTKQGRPDISEKERATKVYSFDEGTGSVVHNRVHSGIDLYIPERFVVLHQVFLRPFWEEYEPTWDYWRDVVLFNIVGFIPFGFLCCAYLSLAKRVKRPGLVTVLLGFAVSLTIECLQALLPTRDSGTTDLITNTLGASLGVWFYLWDIWRPPCTRIWTHLVESKAAGLSKEARRSRS
jgi:hypothetical protein